MTTRATPFGLFASITLGHFGPGQFQVGSCDSLQRRSWLDLGYIYPLVARVVSGPEVREALSYTPNSTLIKNDDAWRYVEEGIEGNRLRRSLVRIHCTDTLDLVIASCRNGLPISALIDLILGHVPDVSQAEASEYINQLIDSQLLVPTLAPTLTGPDPAHHLIHLSADCRALAEFHTDLKASVQCLEEIDRQEARSLRPAYKAAVPSLIRLFDGADEQKLFHVDLRRDAPYLSLPTSILPEVLRAVEALHPLARRGWPHTALEVFRKRFLDRFGDRAVDVMAALDEDTGIGFEVDPGSRRNENLLSEFTFPMEADAPKGYADDRRLRHQIDLLERAWSEKQSEIHLTEDDLAKLAIDDATPLPDLFTVFGSVASASVVSGARDDLCFVLQSVASGVGLFGRFCRSDPDLTLHLQALLRKEEALRPDAIFAELVHLPEDRLGNIVCRPAFRANDLPYLGQSGLDRRRRGEANYSAFAHIGS
jgi:hypothetical protein